MARMSDLISRQAAIDEITEYGSGDTICMSVGELRRRIEHLPSAQPEPIKINIEDFNKEDWERLKKEWENTPITVLPAQPEIMYYPQVDGVTASIIAQPEIANEEIRFALKQLGADMRGEQDDESRSNSNAQTDTRARGIGATDKSSGI